VVHADDEFHRPTSDDPWWTETCWFTFTVPERRLSGQLYPFFRPNLGVAAAACFFWDDRGDQPWNIRHGRQFWHLPLPPQPLSDIELVNGIRYRCLEPLTRYAIGYRDPDGGDEIEVDLTFSAVGPPNHLADSHLDQPGRFEGTIRLEGETIDVDSFGFRDRSWGVRAESGLDLVGSGARRGGYSYATASERDGFHAITMDFSGHEPRAVGRSDDCLAIHGYVLLDGEWSKLRAGHRSVLARDDATGAPLRVELDLTDEAGRRVVAHGRCVNRLGVHLNPNLFTWNCLTEWSFAGRTAWGEDHDNWSAPAARRFFRQWRYAQI
jgi:hypothetical protein